MKIVAKIIITCFLISLITSGCSSNSTAIDKEDIKISSESHIEIPDVTDKLTCEISYYSGAQYIFVGEKAQTLYNKFFASVNNSDTYVPWDSKTSGNITDYATIDFYEKDEFSQKNEIESREYKACFTINDFDILSHYSAPMVMDEKSYQMEDGMYEQIKSYIEFISYN